MIELKNIERSYKTGHTETWVLRRINLTIREGEFDPVRAAAGSLMIASWHGGEHFRRQLAHAIFLPGEPVLQHRHGQADIG